MKRVLIAFITALPLVAGVAAAHATTPTFPGFPGGTGTGTQQAMVAGTVVSVGANSFVANAYVLTPPSMGTGGSIGAGSGKGTGGSGLPSGFPSGIGGIGGTGGFGGLMKSAVKSHAAPTTTEVTITINSSTTIHIGGVTGTPTLSELVPGAKFLALFAGSSSDTIQTLVGSPATSIYAQVPKQFYAFVGTVGATDPTTDTITVDVTRSFPSGLITSGTPTTFTVSSHTFIIGGSSLSSGSGLGGLFGGLFGGSLSDVSTGDLVAGGVIGDTGLTATQVEATPLMFLLDLPAPTTTTSSTTTSSAEKKALKETLNLLHGDKVKLGKSHKKSRSGKHHKHAGSR